MFRYLLLQVLLAIWLWITWTMFQEPPKRKEAETRSITVIPEPKTPIEKNKEYSKSRVIQEIGYFPEVKFFLTTKKEVSKKEIYCLALNIFHEARGESFEGMLGVAQVTLNRLDHRYRGKKTICSVVYDSKQFSWTLDTKKKYYQPHGVYWQASVHVAKRALDGLRIKGLEKSLHYHADWIKHPNWSRKMVLNHMIGQHIYLEMRNV